MSTEPRTGLDFWPAGALQQDLLFNELLLYIAVWTQRVVLSFSNAPPSSPSDGDVVIVGTGTGAFAGHDDDLAYWDGGAWIFFTPFEGALVFNLDDVSEYRYDTGSGWTTNAAGAQVAIQFQENGVDVGGAGLVQRVNFFGATVTPDTNGGIDVAFPGGGATLVGSSTVVGSAAQNIDVAGLDLASDGEYEIRMNLKGAAADGYAYMYYEADYTNGNYYASVFRELGGGGGGAEANDARAVDVVNGACTMSRGRLALDVDGKATYLGDCKSGSTGGMRRWIFSQMRNTAANVTSLRVAHGSAAGFAVGSTVEVWKM